jgi:hypothetical protein
MHLWVGSFEEEKEIIRSANTRRGGKGRGRTSDEIELFCDNRFGFSFRDAILGNIRHVGT